MGLALAALGSGGLLVWLRVLACLVLLPAALWGERWLGLRAASSQRTLRWNSAQGWWLQTISGEMHYVQPVRHPQACGPWVFLHFRKRHLHYNCLLDLRYTEPSACAALQSLFALQTSARRG